MAVESFAFYKSYYENISELSDTELAEVIRAACDYAFFDEEIDVDVYNLGQRFVLRFMIPMIDQSAKRAEMGRKGAEIKAANKGTKKGTCKGTKKGAFNTKTKTETKTVLDSDESNQDGEGVPKDHLPNLDYEIGEW